MIVTDQDFTEIVKSHKKIIIDFWAPWCKPCNQLSPILDEISKETGIWVGKLNIDDNISKPEEYQVTSIPTVILFEDGVPVKRIIGAKPKHVMMKELEEWL